MAVAKQKITDDYAIYMGDCIEVMKKMNDESIHLSNYSPPFGGLYHYSSDVRDLSNSDNYKDFFKHYEYVVKELYRLTLPGRITTVHCAFVPSGNSGNDHMIDFPSDITRLHEKIGWEFIAEYDIWKEPLGVRNRTMAKNLAHQTIVEDSSKCSNAAADKLRVFRKKGENKIPIGNPNGLTYYAGERSIPNELLKYKEYKGKQTENRYSHWIWRQYASAFWDDVRIDRILPYKDARGDKDEKHVHPLQLDVIDRCLILWSNEGENIIDPFAGVGSLVHEAVKFSRKGIGIELKESYYTQMERNLSSVHKSDNLGKLL